jgi:aldose 1-epimerase
MVQVSAAQYAVQRENVDGMEVIRLSDEAHKTLVSIVPSVGNIAYDMKVNGKAILYFPYKSLAEFRDKPGLCGIPFLGPWANRLDQMAFYANGKKYSFNTELGNVKTDGNGLPIHGLLSFSALWTVVDAKADGNSAHVTSRLEFWKHPELMAQFPFAHTIEMTYKLSNGDLEVETVLKNLSAEPMPVSIGFHPYFQLDDAPRDQWKAHLSAREHVVLSKLLVPTGERKKMDLPDPFPLAGHQLDDVFIGLEPNAEFSVQGAKEKITVVYGANYPVAVAYAPPGKNFICFEPMAGLTNAMNLHHAGKYDAMQSVAAGGLWRESFHVRPSGF